MKLLSISFVLAVFVVVSEIVTADAAVEKTHRFQEVIDAAEKKRVELSQHPFCKMLADESIPARKRMQFAPYWSFFAVGAADILDSWIRIPQPLTELETRVNTFVEEDNFHYNLFLHDVEKVLGYGLDRYGSYEAVMRHIWSGESQPVRMLMYAWASGAKRSKDPLVALASFEAIEAGLKDMFEIIYSKVFLSEGGIPELKYFGKEHVELEMNHTVTTWFKQDNSGQGETGRDGAAPRPLSEYELSDELMQICLEVIEDMFYWYHKMFDALYELSVAEDTVYPAKYKVHGYPPLNTFPARGWGRKAQEGSDANKAEL